MVNKHEKNSPNHYKTEKCKLKESPIPVNTQEIVGAELQLSSILSFILSSICYQS